MRITIIGYDHVFVDNLHSELKILNHQVSRIDLYISYIPNDLSRKNDEISIFELRNFHDLTIEIVEFEPDIILYIPLHVETKDGDDLVEINDIIHVEIIEHILETAQIVNSKICYFYLENNNDSVSQRSVELVHGYSRSLIITTNLSEIEFNVILRKILQ